MGLTNFDELNTLSTTETTKNDRQKVSRKKIPIHDYFENMQISEEEKEKRVRLANLLLADVLFLFALSKRNQDHHYLSEAFQKRYLSSVQKVAEPDQKMQRYIRKVCDSIVKTTLKGRTEPSETQMQSERDHSNASKTSQNNYALSIERATNVAENEANAILWVCLTRFCVLCNLVDTFDHNFTIFYRCYLAFSTFIFTSDNLYSITFLNLASCHNDTSLIKLLVLMKRFS